MKRLVLVGLAALACCAPAYADAPAPAPSPKPEPVVVEPIDIAPAPAPVDAPGFTQPDTFRASPTVEPAGASPAPVPASAPAPTTKARPSWFPAIDLTKWTVQLDGGLQVVDLNDGEKHEYATAAVEIAGPLHGFDLWQRSELLGEQDGGRLQYTNPQSFRAVLVDAKVSRAVGDSFGIAVRGGTTFSVEGGAFAPIDSRLWTLQGEASVKLKRLILRGYGGHDGAIGGYGLGGSVELPVAGGRPQLLTSFDYPFSKPPGRESMPLPWQLKAGARIVIAKEFLSDLF